MKPAREVIEDALREGSDSHERWEHVVALHKRGDDESFVAAAELLDQASETLAGIPSLTRPQADRIGVRIDRLTSQLASISPSGRANLLDEVDRAD